MAIKEIDISNALKSKHENLEDIFASQVKIGPMGSKIMDAVAIKKTWSPRTVIGYEIKTSRQDFLNDQKHPVYMENCNIFYFVTPKDIIKKGELPDGAGHMIYNPETKSKLWTARKAPFRDTPISSDVLLHIMFWKFNRYLGFKTRAEMLEDYKATKELKSLGIDIARKIRDLKLELERSKRELKSAREDNVYYRELINKLNKKIEDPVEGLSKQDLFLLQSSVRNLSRLAEKIKEAE